MILSVLLSSELYKLVWFCQTLAFTEITFLANVEIR
jgi:hypothetical protein